MTPAVGLIDRITLAATSTLERRISTSPGVDPATRLRLLISIRSSSQRWNDPTPRRARDADTSEPTPPSPTIATDAPPRWNWAGWPNARICRSCLSLLLYDVDVSRTASERPITRIRSTG